ncbi:MAG TPA: dihydrolipoyllysine-residue succinyltransferase [Candidatus Sulfotelmatobacter sp.]|nr:dihydrolipoyllysine-residue succinyltransferase [Candidatus Sulfotelmatobacter sp.]
MANIVVPELGESVVSATVARWLKREGEPVAAGEAVVELETEKVNLEVGAEQTGILARIGHREGEDVRPGDVLGVIEKAPEPAEVAVKASPSPPDAVSRPSGNGDRDTSAPPARSLQPAPPAAEPAAPKAVTRPEPPPLPAVPQAAPVPERPEERVRLSRRRQTIARRLVEAQRTAAMLTTFNEVDMSRVLDVRARHREAFQERHGLTPGITGFFVKASIGALKAFPRLNAEVQGDEMIVKRYYDIGIAVGAEDGLVVPVLRDADRLSLVEIERAVKEFARKARDGSFSLEELRGGSFTITNGGVFGSLLSTPILNTPQVGILGLHKIEERPVAQAGQVLVRPMMYVALSYDHRIVDGREAVQFLVRVKELIEDPEALLLEG